MRIATIVFKSIMSLIVGVCILMFANISDDYQDELKIALRVFDVVLALSVLAMWI